MGTTSRASVGRTLVYRHDCPSRTVIEVLASKWALYVLAALRERDRPMRFNELRRVLEGITQKMLTQTLRALERDGLITRTVYPTVPPRVEYGLTTLGSEAGRLTSAIAEWSMEHAQEILKARGEFDDSITEDPRPITRSGDPV
ncbi:winged helix-turn-helix transcriptional regulator [Actinopolymorpha pittospori]|uniref:DNA-binding HxlR family transcriptional regulator n=1 Tax=Actinopolymorpha pittospori TaxID=648752 RepID=A0A927N163_9ACTN|nr:helix-turn-helix domain-containing protein [Actinopolymorpha pittospori]MBE1610139.1 DNA-binding HxlR family transcriptional regulator [Actinopolymorpha pittospori]